MYPKMRHRFLGQSSAHFSSTTNVSDLDNFTYQKLSILELLREVSLETNTQFDKELTNLLLELFLMPLSMDFPIKIVEICLVKCFLFRVSKALMCPRFSN